MSSYPPARPSRGTGHHLVRSGPDGRDGPRARRERIRLALACSAAVALLMGCAATGRHTTGDPVGHLPQRNPASPTSADGSPVRAAPAGHGTRTPSPTPADTALARALEPIRTRSGIQLSVAVLEPATGRRAVYGARHHITASLSKVDILAALLLRAQHEDRPLTGWETDTAASMIRSSDNDSADALWRWIGGGPGLTDANRTLGLTSTQAGPGFHWGLTRTTATDQLRLLDAVFADRSPLSGDSRRLIRTFMSQIDDDQAWGVSAEGTGRQLKNGWLQRSQSQRWAVNSMGRVTAHGSAFHLVVLSYGSPSMEHGISAVERAARSAVHALCSTPPPVPPIIR
ncbi:serine hydrolase [Streptomyces sp. NPDC003247]|uniref:serine hydrolase n=1 Tax=Streptomyces sp. NPDC003247 TaxID=3364677 RepID=UPI003686F039